MGASLLALRSSWGGAVPGLGAMIHNLGTCVLYKNMGRVPAESCKWNKWNPKKQIHWASQPIMNRSEIVI